MVSARVAGGVAFVGLGILAGFYGLSLAVACTYVLFTLYCPFQSLGIVLLVTGAIFIVVGIVLAATRPRGSVPPSPSWPSSCPTCGQPLAWIPQYNRWYCSRCGGYR